MLTADWFRRFLAGFAVGLAATVMLSFGSVRAETAPSAPPVIAAGEAASF